MGTIRKTYRVPDDVAASVDARLASEPRDSRETETAVVVEALRAYGARFREPQDVVRVSFAIELGSWQTLAGTEIGLRQALQRLGLRLVDPSPEYDGARHLVIGDDR